MIGTYELYIYLKINDIYILTQIINILNTSTIYQYQSNSIIIKTNKDQLYEYSTNDFNLIKYKNYEFGELQYLKENTIISYKNHKYLNIPKYTYLSLINSKTFENIIIYKTKKIITSIKVLNNETLLVGKDEGIYELKIKENNFVEKNLFFEDKYSSFDNINIIDEETILFSYINYYQKYISSAKYLK